MKPLPLFSSTPFPLLQVIRPCRYNYYSSYLARFALYLNLNTQLGLSIISPPTINLSIACLFPSHSLVFSSTSFLRSVIVAYILRLLLTHPFCSINSSCNSKDRENSVKVNRIILPAWDNVYLFLKGCVPFHQDFPKVLFIYFLLNISKFIFPYEISRRSIFKTYE